VPSVSLLVNPNVPETAVPDRTIFTTTGVDFMALDHQRPVHDSAVPVPLPPDTGLFV